MSEDVIRAFMLGRQMREHQEARARQQQQDAERTEDRKIQREQLQLRLKQMKIDDQITARKLARENVDLLSGQDENAMGLDAFEGGVDSQTPQPGAPPDLASMLSGMGGQAGAPSSPIPPIQPKAMTIPGVEELGVGSVNVRPTTLQQMMQQSMSKARMDAFSKPQSVRPGGKVVFPATGEVLAEGDPVPDKTPALGSPEDYLTRYAQEIGKDPARLTARDVETAFKRRADATRRQLAGDATPAGKKGPTLAQQAMAERWKETARAALVQRFTASIADDKKMSRAQLDAEKLRIENSYRAQLGQPSVSRLPVGWEFEDSDQVNTPEAEWGATVLPGEGTSRTADIPLSSDAPARGRGAGPGPAAQPNAAAQVSPDVQQLTTEATALIQRVQAEKNPAKQAQLRKQLKALRDRIVAATK